MGDKEVARGRLLRSFTNLGTFFWSDIAIVCTLYMMKLAFVWDEAKNIENMKKHGVSFQEASTIFGRIPYEIYDDPDHSEKEHRYLAIGFSDKARALLVSHTENTTGTEIRIISARKMTKQERTDAFGGKL